MSSPVTIQDLRTRLDWLMAAVVLGLLGCAEDHQRVARGLGAPEQSESQPSAPSPDEQQVERQAQLVFGDEDFSEAERNRDPFRSFVSQFKVQHSRVAQREVIMPNTSIDEMQLVAIVSGVPKPRAMFVDPLGVGHVVQRGVFIGRPQVVRTGGVDNVALTLNWRVDRIRDNEVVLSREDPTDPNQPPLTRIVPLHEQVAAGI
ncbi:MAG: pilus assembly protein PilP [Proteobacteria bacterium]|nr:pilus assembly protein PilP [Pseudomonadota bacterium]